MHYYQFNIGDYAKHTRHLTNNEDLAYRRMLDLCYLNEEPLDKDVKKVARLINMRGCEEEVENVLNDFFELKGDHWHNNRVEKDLGFYADKAERARQNGKKGGRPPKKDDTPKPPKKTSKPDPLMFDEWQSKPTEKVLSEWIKHRTKKKATTSQLVITRMAKEINEAFKSGYSADDCLGEAIERGWTGMKAEWIKNGNANKSALHSVSNITYTEGAL